LARGYDSLGREFGGSLSGYHAGLH